MLHSLLGHVDFLISPYSTPHQSVLTRSKKLLYIPAIFILPTNLHYKFGPFNPFLMLNTYTKIIFTPLHPTDSLTHVIHGDRPYITTDHNYHIIFCGVAAVSLWHKLGDNLSSAVFMCESVLIFNHKRAETVLSLSPQTLLYIKLSCHKRDNSELHINLLFLSLSSHYLSCHCL